MSDTFVDDFADDTTTDDTGGDTPPDVDWKAEAEKFKALHKKQEERAKANAQAAADLRKLQQQSMSDLEKAKAEGRDEGAAEARKAVGARLVQSEFKAATVGRNVDLKSLFEALDPSRFLDDDGNPDTERITKFVEKNWPAGEKVAPGRGGPRSTGDKPDDMNSIIRRASAR